MEIMGAPDQKKLQTWDLPAREERCQADYQEVESWSSSPDLMKFSSSIFCCFLFCIIFIKFPTRKSSNSKLPAWSRSLISSALPSMLKYVSLISGILLMYCSERARLSLNLRQRSFFACAHVFGIRISSLKQHPYRFHCELYARSTYRFHPCTFLNCLNFMPEYHRYHSWSRSLAM